MIKITEEEKKLKEALKAAFFGDPELQKLCERVPGTRKKDENKPSINGILHISVRVTIGNVAEGNLTWS